MNFRFFTCERHWSFLDIALSTGEGQLCVELVNYAGASVFYCAHSTFFHYFCLAGFCLFQQKDIGLSLKNSAASLNYGFEPK